MAALSKAKLIEVLKRRLKLESPEFRLERLGERLSGSVISDTFLGIDSYARQQLIWGALEAEFGTDRAWAEVGTLLPYTDAEWHVDLEGTPAPVRRPTKTARRASGGRAPKRATARS